MPLRSHTCTHALFTLSPTLLLLTRDAVICVQLRHLLRLFIQNFYTEMLGTPCFLFINFLNQVWWFIHKNMTQPQANNMACCWVHLIMWREKKKKLNVELSVTDPSNRSAASEDIYPLEQLVDFFLLTATAKCPTDLILSLRSRTLCLINSWRTEQKIKSKNIRF